MHPPTPFIKSQASSWMLLFNVPQSTVISISSASASPARKQSRNITGVNVKPTELHLTWLWYSISSLHPSSIPLSDNSPPSNHRPSWSQTCSSDLKRRAMTPTPADALPGSDDRVTRITQLAGVTKDPAGSSSASPPQNPDTTSATTSRGPPAATNLRVVRAQSHFGPSCSVPSYLPSHLLACTYTALAATRPEHGYLSYVRHHKVARL